MAGFVACGLDRWIGGESMNIMTPSAATKPATVTLTDIGEIAESTSSMCIATRVRQLSRIVTRVYDDALRPLGITASQFTLLTQLAQQDGITAVEIGTELDIEKSTLSRNLKRLLALGHLTMDPPAGRRGRGLHLTPKGQDVIYKGYPVWKDAQARAVRTLGNDSRATLDGLLAQAEKLGPA
jgi:DNA-binding MarR family transcriptional regulator